MPKVNFHTGPTGSRWGTEREEGGREGGRHCAGNRKMMESWAAAVLFRPVNYFHRKLGVFSIIAKDFRRDVAPVSVPATMAVNNNSYNSYNNYNKYNKSLVSSLLSYFKFQTWVTDSVATCCKIFLPFFLMIHFSQLDFYLLCACVCRLVCVLVSVTCCLVAKWAASCWIAMQNMTAQRDWPKQLGGRSRGGEAGWRDWRTSGWRMCGQVQDVVTEIKRIVSTV